MRRRHSLGRSSQRRSLETLDRTLGPEHPDHYQGLTNLGNLELSEERPREAIRYYERALAVLEPAYGERHPLVASTLTAIGGTHYLMGELRETLRGPKVRTRIPVVAG